MKHLISILLLAFHYLDGTAQDINFSQFYELPLLRNPSLAGLYNGDIRLTSSYRSQWGSVTVPYKTQSVSAEIRFAVSEYDYLNIGAQITNDIAGDSKMGKTQFLPTLAFNKSVGSNKSYITIGFIGGAVQQRFDATKLKFDDQFVNGAYSETNPTQQTFKNTSLIYWDISTGLNFSSTIGNTEYYIGAAYFHINTPRVAFNPANDIRLNEKAVINAGVNIPYGESNTLTFYGDYFLQGGNNQGQGGVIYKHALAPINEEDETIAVSVGSFYRWNDAIIPVFKLDYYNLGIGFSYDANISKLRTASNMQGAFELTMVYRNFIRNDNSSLEKVSCPVRF